jgi:hypothetical protein
MTARRVTRALAAVGVCVLACVAAVGWLYLLRDSPALRAGPPVTGALPLQRLAHQEAQPLLRFLLAWAPAGLAAGLALAWLARLGATASAAVAGAVAFVVLFATGAFADAVTANEAVAPHVASQPGHAAPWLAAAVMAVIAGLVAESAGA